MRARDQSSIFSTGGKFRPDYELLLELHALTLVTCSYALLGKQTFQNLQPPCVSASPLASYPGPATFSVTCSTGVMENWAEPGYESKPF